MKNLKYIIIVLLVLNSCNPEFKNLYNKYKYNTNLKRVEKRIDKLKSNNDNYLHISIVWTSGYTKSIDYIYEEVKLNENEKYQSYKGLYTFRI